MTVRRSPTVRRRRLGIELRRLREAARLTIEAVADHMECSTSKVSRMETGQVGARARDVRDMLTLYRVPDDQAEELVQIAREALLKGWWHSYADVVPGPYVGLEAAASKLRTYESQLVPGLMQIDEYHQALIRAVLTDATQEEVQRRMQVRQERRAKNLFADNATMSIWAILDEAVVRRPVGGRAVMRLQLEHLLEIAEHPNVTIQVLPFEAEAHAGMDGAFTILGFPEKGDTDVVYIGTVTSDLYLETEEDVNRYSVMFNHLRASALKPDDSTALMVQQLKEQ